MVDKLRTSKINIIVVVRDTPVPHTPDSIFPDNWMVFHKDGTIVLYPMFAENKRLERWEDILEQIESEVFLVDKRIDYTSSEEEKQFFYPW